MIPGIRFAGIASGIKNAALDLGLVFFDEPSYVTAVYTKDKIKSAHILYNKKLRSNWQGRFWSTAVVPMHRTGRKVLKI